jgi:hypothetical protein
MRARYLDVVDFACSPHESVRPLLRGLRQTDAVHALVSREASEHKGIVQEFELRAIEPIIRSTPRAKAIYSGSKRVGSLPSCESYTRSLNFPRN